MRFHSPGFLTTLFVGGQVAEDGRALPGLRALGPLARRSRRRSGSRPSWESSSSMSLAVDDHAAVGAVVVLELQVEDEVLVLLLRPDALVLGGRQHAVVERPDALRRLAFDRSVAIRSSQPDESGCFAGAGLSPAKATAWVNKHNVPSQVSDFMVSSFLLDGWGEAGGCVKRANPSGAKQPPACPPRVIGDDTRKRYNVLSFRRTSTERLSRPWRIELELIVSTRPLICKFTPQPRSLRPCVGPHPRMLVLAVAATSLVVLTAAARDRLAQDRLIVNGDFEQGPDGWSELWTRTPAGKAAVTRAGTAATRPADRTRRQGRLELLPAAEAGGPAGANLRANRLGSRARRRQGDARRTLPDAETR